jgi:hypothetical protein
MLLERTNGGILDSGAHHVYDYHRVALDVIVPCELETLCEQRLGSYQPDRKYYLKC